MNGAATRGRRAGRPRRSGSPRATAGAAAAASSALDLEVRTGEVFGFLGPNGAGKTTTIRVLLDLIRPTSGRALVLGRDSRRETLAIQARSGYLPGELSLYPNLTGRETLRYLANLRGGVDWDYVAELTERLDCDLEPQGGRPLDRQQAQGRPHPGVHAPARAAHPRRAHLGPRPARPARVLPPAGRGPGRRPDGLPLVARAARGAARVRPRRLRAGGRARGGGRRRRAHRQGRARDRGRVRRAGPAVGLRRRPRRDRRRPPTARRRPPSASP